ncbi:hypothetical protein RJ53_04550 [Methanocalculus chunghsingensis]|uniref:DUF1890 domain-containing protein n=1 Tax=Methanocalculus chunghsingensis TaxID=156457 RepID=A0A8J7W5S2_9EURY|nr:DUF1890 domain-containing protein [Methanocalculus chunghsingensis]MBR1368819.1 hypothetical protein [Methanocalculus chunghsingensis]
MIRQQKEALIMLGCPEIPVQQALALYAADRFNDDGWDLTIAGNGAVLNLLRVSDPKKVYIRKMMDLEKCIDELSAKERAPDLCMVCIHNDAGLSYAASIRYLFEGRFIALVFGRDAEALAAEIDFPCDPVVDVAVHNPGKLRRKLDEVMKWAA